MNNISNYNYKKNDEIDFQFLIKIIIRNKLIVASITVVFFIFATLFAFTKRRVWKGEFQIVLSQESKNNLLDPTLANQNLLNLAGIDLSNNNWYKLENNIWNLKGPIQFVSNVSILDEELNNDISNNSLLIDIGQQFIMRQVYGNMSISAGQQMYFKQADPTGGVDTTKIQFDLGTGNIVATGDVTAYGSLSDINLKDDELKKQLDNTPSTEINKLYEIKTQITKINRTILKVTKEDISQVKYLFDLLNIKHVRARGEADALCSKLCKEGFVDFVQTYAFFDGQKISVNCIDFDIR